MSDILGKIVSAESDEFIRILYPDFKMEDSFDPFESRDIIHTGIITSRIVDRIRSRGNRYIIYTPKGGETSLTREELFHICSKRARKFPEELNEIPIEEFIKIAKTLKWGGILLTDDDDHNIFELFTSLAQGSKKSIDHALNLCDTMGPHRVLYSLLTFFTRVISNEEASTARYSLVLKRARNNIGKYSGTLETISLFQDCDPKSKVLYMVFGVIL